MWFVEKVRQPGQTGQPGGQYWLGGPTGGGRTVGRKEVDIRVKVPSASRLHATLRVADGLQEVLVTDSSAYGTFCAKDCEQLSQHERLTKGTATALRKNAALAFGTPTGWLRLGCDPTRVAFRAGSIGSTSSARVLRLANEAGIDIQDQWTPDEPGVSHLLTETLGVAHIDLILAMVNRRVQVVLPSWVQAVHTMVVRSCQEIAQAPNATVAAEKTALPLPHAFAPELTRELAKIAGCKKLDLSLANDRRSLLASWAVYETDDDSLNELVVACGGILAKSTGKRMAGRSHMRIGPDNGDCSVARVLVAILAIDTKLLPVETSDGGGDSSGTATPPPPAAAPHSVDSLPKEVNSDAETDDGPPERSAKKQIELSKTEPVLHPGMEDRQVGNPSPPVLFEGTKQGFFRRLKRVEAEPAFTVEADQSLIVVRRPRKKAKHRAGSSGRDVRVWGQSTKPKRVYLSGCDEYG